MKVTRTWKGWEPYNCTKKQLMKWLLSDFDPMNLRTACWALHETYPPYNIYDEPKRCKLTIIYEVEE